MRVLRRLPLLVGSQREAAQHIDSPTRTQIANNRKGIPGYPQGTPQPTPPPPSPS